MARPRSDIRERLLRAARRRFLLEGVDGASLRDIAKGARTSVGMVTYYFKNKDDLFRAVLERVYVGLVSDLAELLRIHADEPFPRLIERIYLRVQSMSDDEFDVVRILLREAMVSSKRLRIVFSRFSAPGAHLPLLIGALLHGRARGELREDLSPAAELVSTMALAMVPSLLRRLAAEIAPKGFDVPGPAEAARVMAGILTGGIGKAAG